MIHPGAVRVDTSGKVYVLDVANNYAPVGQFTITGFGSGGAGMEFDCDGNLWLDAGMVTTQADWSLDFDLGMNFLEWHAPVPLAH